MDSIFPGGHAELSGAIRVGDRVLRIGDIDVTKSTVKEVLFEMKFADRPCCVVVEKINLIDIRAVEIDWLRKMLNWKNNKWSKARLVERCARLLDSGKLSPLRFWDLWGNSGVNTENWEERYRERDTIQEDNNTQSKVPAGYSNNEYLEHTMNYPRSAFVPFEFDAGTNDRDLVRPKLDKMHQEEVEEVLERYSQRKYLIISRLEDGYKEKLLSMDDVDLLSPLIATKADCEYFTDSQAKLNEAQVDLNNLGKLHNEELKEVNERHSNRIRFL